MDKKKIATFFLLSSIFIFILSHFLNNQYILVYIIQKVSEAAVVGGFADWFAVTALFKHPLGLKIPHTNILENNRQKLIDSISKTVSDDWLSKKHLSSQINTIDAVSIIINISKKPRYIQSLKKTTKSYIRKFFAYTKTQNFLIMLQKYIDNFVFKLNLYEILKNSTKNFLDSNFFENLYKALSIEIKSFLSNLNPEKTSQFIIYHIEADIKKSLTASLKNALDNNFDQIIDNTFVYLIWLIDSNENLISKHIEDFIENYKNKTLSKDIVITLLEGFNIIDKQALSQEVIKELKKTLFEIKEDKTHKVRLNIKNFIISQIDLYDNKIKDFVLDTIEKIVYENTVKLKYYFIEQLDKPDTLEFFKNWLEKELNSKVMLEFYNKYEFEIKMYLSNTIQNTIKKLILEGKNYSFNKYTFEKIFDSIIHNYLINQLILHKSSFNDFLKQKLNYIMRQNHHLIGETVKKYLSNLKQEQLISQIESKVGNDLQYIRINGSIVGSIVGFIIAIADLLLKKI
ncbi:DUF445 family protein [Desulfurella sp.]|uniref:DUF445 family protein n=1 Tax=Desulfurella sp. TaxID=1962857 RepID=UPI003D0BA2B7